MVAEVWTLGGGFGWHILEHPQQICPMCQMPNIWHIWHTKHKNGALSDVLNLKNYATFYSTISNMRQYRQQLQNQILLFYCVFLSTLPQISLSLSVNSISFLLHNSPPISLPHAPTLVADIHSPHCLPLDLS